MELDSSAAASAARPEDGVDNDRRAKLRAFLQTARANVQPESHQLPVRQRRRTPGLRREEVAELAGVSTAWYTLLETARSRRVSMRMLDRVAKALMLSDADKLRLYSLTFPEMPDQLHELAGSPRETAIDMVALHSLVRLLNEGNSIMDLIDATIDFMWNLIAPCDTIAFLEWDAHSRTYRCVRSRGSMSGDASASREHRDLTSTLIQAIVNNGVSADSPIVSASTFLRGGRKRWSGRYIAAHVASRQRSGVLLYAERSSRPHRAYEGERLALVSSLLALALARFSTFDVSCARSA